MGKCVSRQNGLIVYRTGCFYTGWGVSKRNAVLLSGMGCY